MRSAISDELAAVMQIKIVITFTLLTLLLIALGILGITTINHIQRDTANLRERTLPRMHLMTELTVNNLAIENNVLRHALTDLPEEMEEKEYYIQKLSNSNTFIHGELGRLLETPVEHTQYQWVLKTKMEDEQRRARLLQLSRSAKDSPPFAAALLAYCAAATTYSTACVSFSRTVRRGADQAWQENVSLLNRFLVNNLMLIVVGLVLAGGVSLVLARGVRKLAERSRSLENEIADCRLAEKSVVHAIEEEQQRIARDLHDGLVQHLTGIYYLCEATQGKIIAPAPEEAPEARRITGLIRETIGQARGLARGLYPVGLETRGLLAAIRELAESMETIWGVKCAVNCPGWPAEGPGTMVTGLSLDDETHLFRIAQEAINNAARHGAPSRIQVELARENRRLRLAITDDGRGLAGRVDGQDGMGLRSMHYRARVIGATLTIAPGDPCGTAVTCVVPVAREID